MAKRTRREGSNCGTNNAEPKVEPASTVGANEPTASMEAFMQMMTNMSQMFSKGANSLSESERDASWPGRWMDTFLRANPPRFSGTTNSLEAVNWLCRIEKTFAAMECPEERKLPLAEFLLENDSESWWENHKRISLGNKATWKEFVTAFRGWYFRRSEKVRLQDMMFTLTQNDLSVYDYEAQFASLLRHVPEMANTEKEQIELFENGLEISIKLMLAGLTPTTYSGFVQAARNAEHELQRQSNNKRTPDMTIN